MDFDLIFGLTLIGKATVDQFTVGPGINKFIAHGSISEEATVDDPELLGRFLTVLYIQTNKNPTTALSMAGANATIDGKTVGWLLPAIQRLKIPLPAVEGPQSSFISAFDMGLSLEMDGTQTSGRDGFITSNFSLPFSSKELQTIVKRVGHKLELSELGGSTFARLVTPLSPAGMKDGKLVVNFTNAVLVLTNRQDWSKGFLKPLIQSKNFMVSVSGNLTAEVETTLGNATVRDITLQNTSWNIFGYDGLSQGGKNPVSLESPKVMNNAGNGLQIQVKVVIEGSGGLKIKVCLFPL